MRRIILYGVLLLQLLLIVSLSRGLWDTVHSRQRIDALYEKKTRLLREEDRLRQELRVVESDYYIEKIARETLHLAKPGEILVIVDENTIPSILGEQDVKEPEEKSNWKKWMEVLFGSE